MKDWVEIIKSALEEKFKEPDIMWKKLEEGLIDKQAYDEWLSDYSEFGEYCEILIDKYKNCTWKKYKEGM